MKAKHVSLLLYGRESIVPWGVAHWSGDIEEVMTPATPAHNTVTVYTDPDNDITMAVTTKIAAFRIPPKLVAREQHSIQRPIVSMVVHRASPTMHCANWISSWLV